MGDSARHEELGFREFATRMGWRPSYITQLRKGGRLVLTTDSRRVLVQPSIDRINATRDPSREGVRARHAAARPEQMPSAPTAAVLLPAAQQALPSAALTDLQADADDLSGIDINSPHQLRRAKALADKEEANARKALREELVEMGQLLVRDEVTAAVAEAVVELRRKLEQIPNTLAAALAATDTEAEVQTMLRDGIEAALESTSRKLSSLGRAHA